MPSTDVTAVTTTRSIHRIPGGSASTIGHVLVTLVVGSACACVRPSATGPDDATRHADGPLVEAHEWGFIDLPAQEPGVATTSTAVVYMHLVGVARATVGIRVRAPGGSILEHRPTPADVTEDSVSWTRVDVRRGPCFEQTVPLDEGRALRRYATDDHDCMSIGGVDTEFLWYRATIDPDALPYQTIPRAEGGRVELTVVGGATGGPAWIRLIAGRTDALRIGHYMWGPELGRLCMLDGTEAALSVDEEQARIGRELAVRGVTSSESDAFARAWIEDLLQAPPPDRHGSIETASRDLIHYWVPPQSMDGISQIAITPIATVRREFLVRVALRRP